MNTKEIFEKLQEKFGQPVLKYEEPTGDPFVVIELKAIAEIMTFLKDTPELSFDSLMSLSGLDYPENLTVVYHLFSTRHSHKIVLKVSVPKGSHFVPTVSHVWPTADWYEREAYDLLGIKFEGHPNLIRILMPDDWSGHPLRKDYKYPTEYNGIPHK